MHVAEHWGLHVLGLPLCCSLETRSAMPGAVTCGPLLQADLLCAVLDVLRAVHAIRHALPLSDVDELCSAVCAIPQPLDPAMALQHAATVWV